MSQTHRSLEIILVNDGSTDDSGTICDDYAKRDERVYVIHQENAGVGAARNAGLNVAKGEWIGFIDPDDWIEPEMYEKLLAATGGTDSELNHYNKQNQYSKRDIICCNRMLHAQNKLSRLRENSGPLIQRQIQRTDVIECVVRECRFEVTDKIFERKLADKIRFNENMHPGEDLLFIINALIASDGMTIIPDPLYNYRLHENSAMYSFKKKRMTEMEAWREILPIVAKDSPHVLSLTRSRYFYSLITMLRIAAKNNGEEYLKEIKKEALKYSTNFFFTLDVSVKMKLRAAAILLSPMLTNWIWGIFQHSLWKKIL